MHPAGVDANPESVRSAPAHDRCREITVGIGECPRRIYRARRECGIRHSPAKHRVQGDVEALRRGGRIGKRRDLRDAHIARGRWSIGRRHEFADAWQMPARSPIVSHGCLRQMGTGAGVRPDVFAGTGRRHTWRSTAKDRTFPLQTSARLEKCTVFLKDELTKYLASRPRPSAGSAAGLKATG